MSSSLILVVIVWILVCWLVDWEVSSSRVFDVLSEWSPARVELKRCTHAITNKQLPPPTRSLQKRISFADAQAHDSNLKASPYQQWTQKVLEPKAVVVVVSLPRCF